MAKPKKYTSEFKAKVVRELIEGDQTLSQVASKHGLNPTMISGWRRQLLDNAALVFEKDSAEAKLLEERQAHESEVDDLHRIIGGLTVERDYLQRRTLQVLYGDKGQRSGGQGK